MTDELYKKYVEAVRIVHSCINKPFKEFKLDSTWVSIFLDEDERWRLESWLEADEEVHLDIHMYPYPDDKKKVFVSSIILKDRDGEVFLVIDEDLVCVCKANIWKCLFVNYFSFDK